MSSRKYQKGNEAEDSDTINRLLTESGERDRLNAKLISRLDDSGWRDEVKAECKEAIAENGHDMSMEELIRRVLPVAMQKVPKEVKQEIARDVEKFLEKNAADT